METLGRHVMAEFKGCSSDKLRDPAYIKQLLLAGAAAAKATVVGVVVSEHASGVSGVVVVQESHLSVHTDAELCSVMADFYTCGECVPEAACDVIAKGLGAQAFSSVVWMRSIEGHKMVQDPKITVLREPDDTGYD